MTNEEKIVKYFDNELTSDEKISFEGELETSEELKREFRRYMLVNEKVIMQKRVKLNSDYSATVLHELYERNQGRKKILLRKGLSYSFGLILIVIVSLATFRIFFNSTNKNSDDLEKFTQSLDDNQKLNLLENLGSADDVYSMISGNELTALLEKNLEINSEVMENYDISYQDIIGSLSKSEAEKIYSEILKQNILKEVPL